MAKKKTAKKTSKRTSASGKKTAGRSSASPAKKSGKKTSASGAGSRKSARTVKKTAQKATETKKTAKTKKAAAKPAAAATKAPEPKKAPSKRKPDARKPETKKPETKKPEPRKPATAGAQPDSAAQSKTAAGGEAAPRSTVERKRSSRQKAPPVQFPSSGRLLAPGGPLRKPLIPSGPQNVIDEPLAAEEAAAGGKSPFNKRQLEKFRSMLLDKRRELLGDITGLESEALKSADGSDPRLGEHLEDQSSDAIDQAVSLDLAAADRRLLRMIDEALDRIEKGTFGLCVVTGKPIREERLRELPWASLSIEAARAEERRQMGRL